MRRFVHEAGGAAKFWQVSVEGTSLTVTFGRLGTAGQTKTKSFDTEAAATKEAARLVREKIGKGYVEAAAAPAVPAPAALAAETKAAPAKPPAASDLFGISARKLQGVAAKLTKPGADVRGLLHRAGIAHRDHGAAAWHIAATGLAPVDGPLLRALDDDAPADLSFDTLEAVVRRLGERPSAHEGRNWLASAIRLARRALRMDLARATALGASLPDAARAAFVLAHPAAPSADELALALAQLTGPGGEFAFDGVELLEGFLAHVPLERLAWMLAPRGAWEPDLLSFRLELPRVLAARRDSAEALVDLADRLRARPVNPMNQGLERAFEAAARSVAMHRLAERGAPIPEGLEARVPFGGEATCELPQRMFDAATTLPALALGLAALPRDRALALVDDDLVRSFVVLAVFPDPARLVARLRALELGKPGSSTSPTAAVSHAALELLAGHDPAAMARALRGILERASDEDTRRDARIAGCAVLLAEVRREMDLQARSRGAHLARLELAGERAEDAAALLTTASRVEVTDPWVSSGVESLLSRLPAELRDAAVRRMLAEGEPLARLLLLAGYLSDATLAALLDAALASPSRVDWKTVERVRGHARVRAALPKVLAAHTSRGGEVPPEAAIALGLAAAPPKETPLARLVRWSKEHADGRPTRRLYAANRRAGAPTGSRVEGPGPAIDRAAHGIPDDAAHALTLDLVELPELAERFPGARLFSVYAPSPSSGEWDDGWIVTSPALPDAPAAGEPHASRLELTPIDVPAALFAPAPLPDDDRDAARELRELLLAQHGWVLGKPSWVQDPVGPDDGFVMQFGRDLGRDFGTADNGEVYVFDDHVFLQSH
ncbi:MAG: WGR domain-containing protein [Sandaracinus sp.]